MKFKLYTLKSAYTAKLDEINLKLGFPNKKYSKILGGKRKHFVADKIMTRTWADENPRLTKLNQLAFPVSKELEKDFIGLVEYNPEWYPIKLEPKIITK